MGLLKAAGRAPDPAAPASPAPSLADPDPGLRRRAVQALAQDGDAVDKLLGVLRDETDKSVRQAAFTALAAIGSDAAVDALAGLLADPEAALRNGALEALGAMPAQAAALLDQLGRHEDPDVRSFAVLLAADLPQGEADAWLAALARSEADANVCAHLAEVLGQRGADEEGVAALHAIAARFAGSPFLRFAVDTALRQLSAG